MKVKVGVLQQTTPDPTQVVRVRGRVRGKVSGKMRERVEPLKKEIKGEVSSQGCNISALTARLEDAWRP